MRAPLLLAIALAVLVGCSSDEETVPTTSDDGGFGVTDGLPSETTPDTATAVDTTPAADTTAPPTDSAPVSDAPSTTIKCAAVTCQRATQDCCVTGGMGSCVASGGTCAGPRYSCTSSSECGSGKECCVIGTAPGGATCTNSGSCGTATTCDSNADCSGKLSTCKDLGYIKVCST